MNTTYILEMDNELGEPCEVVTKFDVDYLGRFEGFTRIYSDKPLSSEDLAHLEQFVVQGKNKWVTKR